MSGATFKQVTVPAERTCSKCKVTKPRSEFGPAKTSYGLYPSCKECNRERAIKNYYATRERKKEKVRARTQTPEYKEMIRIASAEYRRRNPHKAHAHTTLKNAIRDGKIKRGSCESCGALYAQGHHHDYSKPLVVEWLCGPCHKRQHRRTEEGLALAARGR